VTDWKAIIDRHGQLVWATARRLVGNDADASDCFQETFLEAIKVARREAVGDWGSLLRHLATARSLDLLRVRYRQRRSMDAAANPDAVVSREGGPAEMAEASELAERLRVALGQLPRQQAEVFCLSRLEKLSYREVAERLRLTTDAVGVLLHRARGRLRKLLIPVDAGTTDLD
jgi:RNA polymerase sigma-70 factor (ECF subfamily)